MSSLLSIIININRKRSWKYYIIFLKSSIFQNKKNMEKHTWHRAQFSPRPSNMPLPRWGHSCCVIQTEVVFFGGYAQSIYMNDIWTFNTTTMEWKQVKTMGEPPSVRSNCSMSYDSVNNQIVIFGGGGPNKKRFNSINILNWQTKTWTEINPKQFQPSPWQRTYHCAQLLYPYLIIFGGQGISDMDDLWIFNFQTMSWKQIHFNQNISKNNPCARRFHSSALIGNQFFVIGGCHGKYRCLSDVYSIDFTSLIQKGDIQGIQGLQWKDRKPQGSAFLTRWGHTSTAYDNKVYIFGGRFSNDLNDLLVLDIEKNTIKTLKICSELPKARRRHSACFIGSCMLIFGGFNGEYYNDLYYINVFQLKSKLQVSTNTIQQNIKEILNEKKFSDFEINTTNGKFYVLKELLMKGFSNQNDRDRFLVEVQGKIGKEQLTTLVSKIYRGYGSFTTEEKEKYHICIPDSQQEYEDYLRNDLLKLEEQPQKSLIRRKNLLPLVIQLSDQQFSNFLDQNREQTYKDSTIIINNSYLLRTNSAILSLNSSYFRNAFSKNYTKTEKNQKQIKLTLNTNNLVIFEITLNYLLLDKVIVPIQMGVYSWLELYEMADYLCLKRLKSACELQIMNIINEQNYLEVLTLSLSMQMNTLALYCADYEIKYLVNQQNKFQLEPTMNEQKNKIIENMYNLSKFDILQVKLERLKARQESLKKKQSSSTQDSQDKENFQTSHSINID